MKLQRLSFLLLSSLSIAFASTEEQIVMEHGDEPFVPQTRTQPTLSDLLTLESSVSIFYSYARELKLSKIFEEKDVNLTLLAPTNKAVMALARKPHLGQGPDTLDSEVEISEEEFDKLSRANVERWVSAHIIPESPIRLESKEYQTLLQGKSVSFRLNSDNGDNGPEWSHATLEGKIHIVGMKKASNGVLYRIDGAISVD